MTRTMSHSTRSATILIWALVASCAAPAADTPDVFDDAVNPEPDGAEDTPGPAPEPDTTGAPDPAPDADTVEITLWDVSSPETNDGPCSCNGPTHCDEDGLCAPDLCEKGRTTCATPESLQHCHNNGGGFEVEPCFPGQACQGGACVDPICEPGAPGGCYGTSWLACNSLGTEWAAYPCPLETPCQAGACRPVESNVLLLIDTSGSMNWTPAGDFLMPCSGNDCDIPWTFPICDNPEQPVTRLGTVKAALNTVVQSEAASTVRLAMQRFPQRPFGSANNDFDVGSEPQCDGGYWTDALGGQVTGDTDEHYAPVESWFGEGLDEIIVFPFADETNLPALARWFDFTVEAVTSETFCEDADFCAGGPCVDDLCLTTTNPELRGLGLTPLGKSLFYAGEYLRQLVLVEGKPCSTDPDCGSPHHTCNTGVCHDPFGHCRDTIIILFTDGDETRNVSTTDFFNPRVQAKRLRYGLGCDSDGDCLAGASCQGGICRVPLTDIDPTQLVCDAGEKPCSAAGDCPDPCGNWGDCSGGCAPVEPTLVSTPNANHLSNYAGNPISVRVHVVDASGVEGNNTLLAVFGGGQHFSVDLDDPEDLVASVYELIGDTKDATPCAPE